MASALARGPDRGTSRLRGLAAAAWRRAGPLLTSTWALGALVALAAWNVIFGVAIAGLDESWNAGMHMAAQLGLHFGDQIIWTYGPLAFLQIPATYYSELALLGFVWQALVLVGYCTSLVWALRRFTDAAVATLVAFLTVVALPEAFAVLVIAAVWCLAALGDDPPPFASRLVSVGGAAFGALECLVRLTWGPTILLMCLATLIALPGRRRELPIFAATAVAVFAVLWFAAGQSVGNVGDFLRSAAQVVSGYSDGMSSAGFNAKGLPLAAATSVFLVAASVYTARPGHYRVAAAIVMGLPAFTLWKEAVVRYDENHVVVFFATAAPLLMAIPWRGRMRLVGGAALAAVAAVALVVTPSGTYVNFNPITHLRSFATQVRTAASPGRRRALIDRGRFITAIQYGLEPGTVALLRGHGVHVDPWSASVVWAYRLKWHPLPVFQDYQAYSSALDHDNATALRAGNGPDRILRENVVVVEKSLGYTVPAIDNRYPAWDPPEAALAMLCNFAPLQTTPRWQVLGRVPDRCAAPRQIGLVRTRAGQTVTVPRAGSGDVVFARIHGAGVGGLERLRSFLFRARFRYAIVNGRSAWRLVPGTAADGLVMSVPHTADFPGQGFTLSPEARTLSLRGTAGPLTIAFFAMPIRAQG